MVEQDRLRRINFARREQRVFLRGLPHALTSANDWASALATVARYAVPVLGDYCLVTLRATDGETYSSSHSSQGGAALGEEDVDWIRKQAGGLSGIQPIPSAIGRRISWWRRRTGWMAPLRPGAPAAGLILATRPADSRGPSRSCVSDFLEVVNGVLNIIWRMEHFRREARARDEFMISVSHELKTPLTVLRLQSHSIRRAIDSAVLLSQKDLALQVARQVESEMDRQIGRLEMHVQNVIEASRAGAGSLPLNLEWFDLGDTVQSVLNDLKSGDRRFESVMSVLSEDPVIGHWDRSRIVTLIRNLMSNAIKFGQRNPIRVILSGAQGRARLVVTDSGLGMARGEQQRIFERFSRAVSAVEVSGLGLGLYVARSIALSHGGDLRVESEIGKGTSFIMDLPTKVADSIASGPGSGGIPPEKVS